MTWRSSGLCQIPGSDELLYRRHRPGECDHRYVGGQLGQRIGKNVADEPLKTSIELIHPGDNVVSRDDIQLIPSAYS